MEKTIVGAWKWLLVGASAVWLSTPAAVQVLLVLMACDYVSGVLCAVMLGTWCARVGWQGLARKVMTLLLVLTVRYAARPLNLGFDLASAAATGFAVNELASVVRNCAVAGVPIPDVIVAAIAKVRGLAASKSAAEVERDLGEAK
jgi:toxin secretion/phage lysis holin